MADQYIGPYRVVREIGRGGMGAVFEAVQPQIERKVAIKVLHPQYAKNEQLVHRFFNEARAVNIVAHPSIVQISEFAQLPDGTAYIVMEFLEGESLGSRMKRQGGKLSLVESLRLARQIAAALAAAHAKNIIHRDLKPDNVMIVADPEAPGGERAKVLDFGIAKGVAAALPNGDGGPGGEAAVSTTRTGVMVGTPLYMAPEQCKGSGVVDAKADVYSLGVMLFRMLCGRPPFIGDGAGAVMAMHIYEPPPNLRELEPSVPEDLAGLVHQLLEKNPAMRPTMLQVAQSLEALKAIHSTGMLASGELRALASSGMLSGAYGPISQGPSTPAPSTPIPLTPAPITGHAGATAQGLGPVRISRTGDSGSQASMASASVSSSALLTLSQVGGSSHANQPVLSNGTNSVSQTLGPAEAQNESSRRRSALVPIITVAGSVLLGAALFGIVALRQSDTKDGHAPDAPPTTSMPAHKVTWSIQSDPPGATVVRATDQRTLGRTPWRSEQPASQGSVVLILRLPGYADRVVTIDQTANTVVKESLQALVATPPAAAAQPQTPQAGAQTQPVRWFKRGGKRFPVKAPVAADTPTTASAPPSAAPPPVAAPKPNPPPPKEETSHARIQVVD